MPGLEDVVGRAGGIASGLGSVLGFAGALSGLLGSRRRQRRLEEMRRDALRRFSAALDAEELALQREGARALAAFAGQLGSDLSVLGRHLPVESAAHGLYGSSADRGLLAQAHESSASALGRALADVAGEMARLRARNRQALAERELELMGDDLGYHRSLYGDALQGLGSALTALSTMGKSSPAPSQRPSPSSPPPLSSLQSVLQTGTQGMLSRLAVPNIRNFGPLMNGMQGSRLPEPSHLFAPPRSLLTPIAGVYGGISPSIPSVSRPRFGRQAAYRSLFG